MARSRAAADAAPPRREVRAVPVCASPAFVGKARGGTSIGGYSCCRFGLVVILVRAPPPSRSSCRARVCVPRFRGEGSGRHQHRRERERERERKKPSSCYTTHQKNKINIKN